jgi:hypothetical protein
MFEQIIYEDKQITAITVKWKNDFTEAMGVLKTFFDDCNTQHLLLDLRNSSLDYMNHEHIRDLCEYATSRIKGGGRVNGNTALVGSNDLQLEICEIFKSHSEMIDSAIKVSVFPSTEEALSWIEEG